MLADTKALRIAPNELHITDTSLYKVLYRQSNPFPKQESFYLGFLADEPTVFTEVDAGKHKERRRLLNPMFSRTGVVQLEPLIKDKLQQLESKIDRLCLAKPINMNSAFRYVQGPVQPARQPAICGGTSQSARFTMWKHAFCPVVLTSRAAS